VTPADLAAGEPARRRLHDLDLGDRRLAQSAHFREALGRRRDHLGEGAEPGEQRLGQRLEIAAGDRPEQDELEQLVVGERLRAGLEEARPQPLAMSEIVRHLRAGARHLRPVVGDAKGSK
jgi:hypothetical protein